MVEVKVIDELRRFHGTSAIRRLDDIRESWVKLTQNSSPWAKVLQDSSFLLRRNAPYFLHATQEEDDRRGKEVSRMAGYRTCYDLMNQYNRVAA